MVISTAGRHIAAVISSTHKLLTHKRFRSEPGEDSDEQMGAASALERAPTSPAAITPVTRAVGSGHRGHFPRVPVHEAWYKRFHHGERTGYVIARIHSGLVGFDDALIGIAGHAPHPCEPIDVVIDTPERRRAARASTPPGRIVAPLWGRSGR